MRRAAIATLVVTLAGTAQADSIANPDPAPKSDAAPTAEAAPNPPPDEIADIESREANLESTEARRGLTLTFAPGGDIMIGGDIGVGRGPALAIRLGHVATRKTLITFELTLNSALHKLSEMGPTLTDTSVALFAGAQRYTTRSLWVRAAGGVTALAKNTMTDGTGGDKPIAGIGGLVGAGVDVVRLRYFVAGFETLGMASLSRDGLKLQLAFALGLTFYL